MRHYRTNMRLSDILRGSMSVIVALAIFFFILAFAVFIVKILAG